MTTTKICPDIELHRLVCLNPHKEEDRRKFDGKAIMRVIRRNPNAAKAKYCTFHSQCSVYNCEFDAFRYSSYPLHLVVSLNASADVVAALQNAFPQAVKEKDGHGRTPLHCACQYHVSLDVVLLLLEMFPDAAKEHDNENRTPLHYTCLFKSTLTVASRLLQIYPEATREKDGWRTTPLFYALLSGSSFEFISLLLKSFPGAAKERSDIPRHRGMIPLHTAIQKGASLEIVKLLLETYPGALKERDSHGETPLEYDSEVYGVSQLMSYVSCLLCQNTNSIRIKETMKYFVDGKWWGGVLLVINIHPNVLYDIEIYDGVMPGLFELIGCQCTLLTLWEILRNRQNLFKDI